MIKKGKVLGILFVVTVIIFTSVFSVNKEVIGKVLNMVSGDRIINHISFLTSVECDGRLTGTQGNEIAANFLADCFKNYGLSIFKNNENYRQYFLNDIVYLKDKPLLYITDKSEKILKNYNFRQNFSFELKASSSIKGVVSGKIYLARTIDDLTNINSKIKNKIVLINNDLFKQIGRLNYPKLITRLTEASGFIREDDVNALDNKVFTQSLNIRSFNYSKENKLILMRCDSITFKELSQLEKTDMKVTMKVNTEFVEDKKTFNIVGFIPSSTKDYIIVGAHYDHTGNNKDGTYNPGAADNAAGVSCMLEIIKVLKDSGLKFNKNIIFAAFNSEETGGTGSEVFASSCKDILENSVMINLDMLGTKNDYPLSLGNVDKRDTKLRDDLYKYALELGIKVEKIEEPSSDHANFSDSCQSVILIDEDTSFYHYIYDTVDKMDKDELSQIVRLVIYYILNK